MLKKILPIFVFVAILISSILFLSSQKPIETTNLKEAMYWKPLGGGMVQCLLCPRKCILRPGQRGVCRVRQNIAGKLYSLSYGHPVAIHLDPIEKKPLFHFLPGTKAFSLATVGCNLRCLYCQNWEISQASPEKFEIGYHSPEEIVQMALNSGAKSIAYTYTEPTVFYEYMIDIARLARKAGLKNVVISAGYINPEPLKELCQYVDAIKIDLKAFNNDFYRQFVGGELQPALETLKTIKKQGVWLEIVYLVIPGENDSPTEIRQMCQWILKNLGPDTPLHFLRYFPAFKLNLPPTPPETVKRLRQIAIEQGLNYVYTGNLGDETTESTYCPNGKVAIKRKGYFIEEINLKNGRCPEGQLLPGVWE